MEECWLDKVLLMNFRSYYFHWDNLSLKFIKFSLTFVVCILNDENEGLFKTDMIKCKFQKLNFRYYYVFILSLSEFLFLQFNFHRCSLINWFVSSNAIRKCVCMCFDMKKWIRKWNKTKITWRRESLKENGMRMRVQERTQNALCQQRKFK